MSPPLTQEQLNQIMSLVNFKQGNNSAYQAQKKRKNQFPAHLSSVNERKIISIIKLTQLPSIAALTQQTKRLSVN